MNDRKEYCEDDGVIYDEHQDEDESKDLPIEGGKVEIKDCSNNHNKAINNGRREED